MRRILVGMIAVLLLLGFPGIAAAQEGPEIDFWPKNGVSGTSIWAWGRGFTPNTFVRIFFGEEQVTIAASDMSGNFWASFGVREEGKIVARDEVGKEAIAKEGFKLIPQAWLEPSRTIINRMLKLKGVGFPKNREILIYFEGKKVSAVFLANRRDFETDFWVPVISDGYRFLELKGEDLITLARADFYVEPQIISLSPSQGKIGTEVQVEGRGLAPNSLITIYFDDRIIQTALTDMNGYFRSGFVVPLQEPGKYGVEIVGGARRLLSIFEILSPTLISASRVEPGEKIIIQVIGALPSLPVRIFLDDHEITLSATPAIGPDGTLKIEVIIPSLLPRNYSLRVFKGTRSEISQTITLLPEPPGKIERVLAPISQYLIRVWSYEAGKWKLYDPTSPDSSDLKKLERGRGYLLLVKENCELPLPSGSHVYQLYRGWNLIGWLE